MNDKQEISKGNTLKFIIMSLIGICAFMIPIKYHGSMNTCVGILTSNVQQILGDYLLMIVLVVLIISLIGSLLWFILTVQKKKSIPILDNLFKTTFIYFITKIIAVVVALCVNFQFGPQIIRSDVTGETMIGLGKTLISIAIALSYFLPFLTETGLMEFVGVLTRKFVRPLFKVPSDASIDLIASWMGASSAAVILSAEKYKQGYYTKKEAGIVMCNFSLVSIPFCMLIAGTAGVETYFPVMYATLCGLGILLAVLLPRIYPLNGLSDNYYNFQRKDIEAVKMKEKNIFHTALTKSCKVVESFHIKEVGKSGTNVLTSILFTLLPIVIAWGTLGLILVEYTPLLQWISLPFGAILNILGVEQAYTVAPATLAGFVDMFIPSLLVANVASLKTRFIIATLSLIQIIYITEVGAVIVQTDLGIDMKKLFLIFLERTIISLPIIVLISNIIF